jgi:predicted site-specific integrase-resolvase
MPALTIARAAREAGVNIETIRFYERKGLIGDAAQELPRWLLNLQPREELPSLRGGGQQPPSHLEAC